MGLFSKNKSAIAAPAPDDLRPSDKATGAPLAPKEQPGYFPGFSTMGQKSFWETATRKVVENRVQETPKRTFFTASEFTFWTVVFDHLIPQTDRTVDRQIPLVAPLDERLAANKTDGYRYVDMPTDRVAYHLGIDAIQAEAKAQFNQDFLDLPYTQQDLVLEALHDGKPQGGAKIWREMSVTRFWELIISDAIKAYYAHPWSWDEIGFGGPAYPRAYTRLERGEPEPWEVNEQRYEWNAPAASVSDKVHCDTESETESKQATGSGSKRSK